MVSTHFVVVLLCALQNTIAADVHLWASAPVTTWASKADLDAVCNAEFAGAIALVCTSGRSVNSYFAEAYNVSTWSGMTIATAGSVKNQLFGAGSLGNSILTLAGGSTGTDNISTSCNATGYLSAGLACGSNAYSSKSGSMGFGTSSGDWLSGFTDLCNTTATYRIYCIEGPYVTLAPTTLAPTQVPTTRFPTAAPTLAPTQAPTQAPATAAPNTFAPTRVPSTAAPTRAPTLAPTGVPSTAAPTRVPSGPPTTAPTTPAPNTLMPTTIAPSRVPSTRAPSTRAPTDVPTRSPTTSMPTTGSPTAQACPTCSARIFPGADPNATNFVDYKIGPPGALTTIVLPPGSVPNCALCSVLAGVFPVAQGPPITDPAADQMLRFEVYDGAVERAGNVNLTANVNFLMPYPQSLINCNHDIMGQCVWWTGSDWSTAGCTSTRKVTGTLCLCNHFTIFAVRIDPDAVHPCRARLAPSLVYQAFIGVYAIVIVYTVIAIGALVKLGGKSHAETIFVHSLVCLDALLRLLGCISYAGYFGDEPVLGLFVALPYALEYFLFSRITRVWPTLVPFAMLSADMRWRRVKKYFLLLNFLGLGLSIGLFAIYIESGSFLSILSVSYIAVVLVTIFLACLYIATSLCFYIYSIKILIEMRKGESGLSIVVDRHVLAPFGAIRWFGRTAAVLFVIQGAVGILAVAILDQFVVWISISFSANVLALFFTLGTYWGLFVNPTPRSNEKSVGFQTTELAQLQTREPPDETGYGARPPPPTQSPASTFGSTTGFRPPPPSSFPASASSHNIIVPGTAEATQQRETDYSPNTQGKHRPCASCGAMLDPCAPACSSCGQTPETRDCPRCGLAISSKYLNCVACGSRLSVW